MGSAARARQELAPGDLREPGPSSCSVGGMIYLGAMPKAVPHIIEVDRLGAAVYLGPVGQSATTSRPTR